MTKPLLHDLLRSSAARDPGRPAIIESAGITNYASLDERSDRIAGLLRELGVRPGDRVGVFLEKSGDAVAGLYGAMKAGACYVPLDSAAPAARVAYIASDCGIEFLLTGSGMSERWGELAAAGAPVRHLVCLDEADEPTSPPGINLLGPVDVARSEPFRDDPGLAASDLAYILYTSGSTGSPKGVMLSHLNAMTFVEWTVAQYGIAPEDRLSNHAPLHFDLSIFDLFAAAMAGASVTPVPTGVSVFPSGVKRFIEDQHITIWYSVPSVLTMMALKGGLKADDCPDLRTILFAGEVFPTKYLKILMDRLPHVEFHNLYGPTETNVCTHYPVPRPLEGDDPIPIGRAIDGVDVFAVGDDGTPAARGEVGELLVTGPGVMRGYWGDQQRTDRALVADPAGEGLAYRTGDLVRQRPGGDYDFLGRRDSQIKSRGYRVELGDIEAAIDAHPDVVECAVTPVPDEFISNRIIAHVAANETLSADALASFCAERVPGYMVPERFVFMEFLPKTSTGKIDRRALQEAADPP